MSNKNNSASSSNSNGDQGGCQDTSANSGCSSSSDSASDVDLNAVDSRKGADAIQNEANGSKKEGRSWTLKFSCDKFKSKTSTKNTNKSDCICIDYKKNEPTSSYLMSSNLDARQITELRKVRNPNGATPQVSDPLRKNTQNVNREDSTNANPLSNQSAMFLQMPVVFLTLSPIMDISRFNQEYQIEDVNHASAQRLLEVAEDIDPHLVLEPSMSVAPPERTLRTSFPSQCPLDMRQWQLFYPPDISADSVKCLFNRHFQFLNQAEQNQRIHTQVDFIHCLVPDLKKITACSFYWGKMDRYEAESLLDGKKEGTFLLRDSVQEEFLFSVSFRKYGRSLHARIEQFNHRFSFDSHDPGVYSSSTVIGLLEHYKDPTCVMFFEPMLTVPLNRNYPFSLQQLCRSVIVSKITYDGISMLGLPSALKSYLREYHYKQKVRVKRFDDLCMA